MSIELQKYEITVKELVFKTNGKLYDKFMHLVSFPSDINYWKRTDIFHDKEAILKVYKEDLKEFYEFGRILCNSRVEALNIFNIIS